MTLSKIIEESEEWGEDIAGGRWIPTETLIKILENIVEEGEEKEGYPKKVEIDYISSKIDIFKYLNEGYKEGIKEILSPIKEELKRLKK